MNRAELEKVLPHRDTMLLLDSAEIGPDGAAYAKRLIRGDEFFLDGHFPGDPIVPGVILCEILAQSACVLLRESAAGSTALLTGLDRVKFKNPVRPGDTVETRCVLTAQKGVFYRAEGEVHAGGRLCVSAQFSFAVIDKQNEDK
ncbi:MAG: beta-hydroxyacyl-ACP dehydratase [Clostridiales bacterium]|nr:beta-hydroxyacyl-ACP dehydratase [Clostridiales bacterium]